MKTLVTHIIHGGRRDSIEKVRCSVDSAAIESVTFEELAFANVLEVRRGGNLGDIVMMTPAISALRRVYPRLKFKMITNEPYGILFDNLPSSPAKPDVVASLEMYPERHPLAWKVPRQQLFATGLGCVIDSGLPTIWTDVEDPLPSDPNVIIAVDATDPRRALPDNIVLELLDRFGGVVVGHLDRSFRVDLRTLMRWLKGAELIITTDNGVSHLAAALTECPVVTVYTTVPPRLRCWGYPNTIPYQHPVCSSCCEKSDEKGCSLICTRIDVNDLYEKVRDVI